MCDGVDLTDIDVQLYWGYWKNHLAVGEFMYEQGGREEDGIVSREKMVEELQRFSKDELIEVLLRFVDEGEEW